MWAWHGVERCANANILASRSQLSNDRRQRTSADGQYPVGPPKNRNPLNMRKTVAMPPKIRGRVSPNCYAPEFSRAVFLQISYTPENRGRSFAKRLCPRNVGAEFSDNDYAPEFSERFFTNNLSPKIGGSLKKIYVPEI